MNEQATRSLLVELAASLFARGFAVGSAGNISARVEGGYLITPTNSSLGRLDVDRISKLDDQFAHICGDRPSKEVFMHRAFYTTRPDAGAVVHLHSTMATAVACLEDVDTAAPIQMLTPYFVMRIGRSLPIVPYFRPGDPAMAACSLRRGALRRAGLALGERVRGVVQQQGAGRAAQRGGVR